MELALREMDLGFLFLHFGKLGLVFYFLKDLFLERGKRKEKERERNINVWLLLTRPPPQRPGPQPRHVP